MIEERTKGDEGMSGDKGDVLLRQSSRSRGRALPPSPFIPIISIIEFATSTRPIGQSRATN
jgi:hypothetical protein